MTNKSKVRDLIEQLKSSPNKFFYGSSEAFESHFGNIFKAYEFVEISTLCGEELKSQARNNLVINIISSLENYFRDIVARFEGQWASDGMNKILEEKA